MMEWQTLFEQLDKIYTALMIQIFWLTIITFTLMFWRK